jgi:hypothetical protein
VKRRRQTPGSIAVPPHMRAEGLAARIQRALASRGLTLFGVSRESHHRYPNDSAYRIPHHFYADVANENFSPRIEQILAFSVITNYRLVDWLALFGVRLDDAPTLVATLPTERTTLLDAEIYDREAWITWFRSKPVEGPAPPIAPIGQLLESGVPRSLKSLLSKSHRLSYMRKSDAVMRLRLQICCLVVSCASTPAALSDAQETVSP